MTGFGWKAIAVLGLLVVGGGALVIAGHAAEGGTLIGAGVLISLALFGVKKVGK